MSHHTQTKGSLSCTKMKTFKFHHTWKITDFRSYLGKKFLQNVDLNVRGCEGLQCAIELYPNGASEQDKGYVSLYLRLAFRDRGHVVAAYKLSLQDVNQRDFVKYSSKPVKFKEGGRHGLRRLVKLSNLLNRLEDLSRDEFSVCCQFEVAVHTETDSTPNPQLPRNPLPCLLWRNVNEESRRQTVAEKGKKTEKIATGGSCPSTFPRENRLVDPSEASNGTRESPMYPLNSFDRLPANIRSISLPSAGFPSTQPLALRWPDGSSVANDRDATKTKKPEPRSTPQPTCAAVVARTSEDSAGQVSSSTYFLNPSKDLSESYGRSVLPSCNSTSSMLPLYEPPHFPRLPMVAEPPNLRATYDQHVMATEKTEKDKTSPRPSQDEFHGAITELKLTTKRLFDAHQRLLDVLQRWITGPHVRTVAEAPSIPAALRHGDVTKAGGTEKATTSSPPTEGVVAGTSEYSAETGSMFKQRLKSSPDISNIDHPDRTFTGMNEQVIETEVTKTGTISPPLSTEEPREAFSEDSIVVLDYEEGRESFANLQDFDDYLLEDEDNDVDNDGLICSGNDDDKSSRAFTSSDTVM